MGRGHDHDALGLPVQDEAQVQLAGDVRGALDPKPVNPFPRGIGLLGHQLAAEEGGREALHLVHRLAEFDAAGGAAAPGMDLRLHDPSVAAELARPVGGLFGRVGQPAPRDRHGTG